MCVWGFFGETNKMHFSNLGFFTLSRRVTFPKNLPHCTQDLHGRGNCNMQAGSIGTVGLSHRWLWHLPEALDLRWPLQLARRLAEKRNESYSSVAGLLRCRFSFAMARSALICLRGSRGIKDASFFKSLDTPVDLVRQELRLHWVCPSLQWWLY